MGDQGGAFLVERAVIIAVTPHGVAVIKNLNHYPPRWELPGGRKRGRDSNIFATAVRKVHEEIGLQARVGDLHYIGEYASVNKDGSRNHLFLVISSQERGFVRVLYKKAGKNRKILEFIPPADLLKTINLDDHAELLKKKEVLRGLANAIQSA